MEERKNERKISISDMLNEMVQSGKMQELSSIRACNEYSQKYGVLLSEQDAVMLLQSRKDSLKSQERVEFGGGIIVSLIYAFCDSPYIYQDNYACTLASLQEIFYLYKNESLDELTDDELITYMKESFDGECQGSLEYLEATSLEDFARNIRCGCTGFMGKRGYDYE